MNGFKPILVRGGSYRERNQLSRIFWQSIQRFDSAGMGQNSPLPTILRVAINTMIYVYILSHVFR